MKSGVLSRGLGWAAAIFILELSLALPSGAADNVWTAVGPWGGTVHALAVHLGDPRILYAATDNGVFVTADGGASWRVTSSALAGRAVSDVDWTPSALYAVASGRLFRSTDAGTTWQRRRAAGAERLVQVFVHVAHPGVLLAGGAEGVLRSVDGGDSFAAVARFRRFGEIESAVFAAWNPSLIFLGLSGSGAQARGVLRSRDGGATWEPVAGVPVPPATPSRVSLAASLDAPGYLWAAVRDEGHPGNPVSLYRTRDEGETWELQAGTGYPIAGGRIGIVYSAAGEVSHDFGESWQQAERPAGQVLALVTSPHAPGTAWAATAFRGVYKTTDASASWHAASQGIAGAEVKALAIDPVSPSVLYAGLLGGGLHKTLAGGAGWQELDAEFIADGFQSTFNALAVEPLDHERVYAAMDDGRNLRVSGDGGGTWSTLVLPALTARVSDLTPDPGARGVVYAPGAAADGECPSFKTADGGLTWTCLGLGAAKRIVVDPREPASVYALTDVLMRSADRGRTWRTARRGVPRGAVFASLAVSPSSPNVLYLGTSQGVFQSIDRAQSWHPATVGLPADFAVLALAVDPRTPEIVWAGVDGHGVYRTVDGGAHWRPLSAGLPLAVSGQLVLDPASPTTAYAGSFGGVYKITVR